MQPLQADLQTSRRHGVAMLAGGGLLMGTIGVFVEEAHLGALPRTARGAAG
jgi:hypothetical protein